MNKVIKKPELLAPAGNLEKLKWAIKYGADAVYIGGKDYSLRANNDNFSLADIKEACLYAHQYQAKVYVTINIIFHNKDVAGLNQYLKKIGEYGVDGIIISDPLVLELAKKIIPQVDIFLSTQQSTINYEAVDFWKKEGINRIILAREAAGEDIKEIIEKTGMDIEIFVHGAMCVGYSGRCLLSNYLTKRDSNRGGCSQICRWNFSLQNNDNKQISNDVDFAIAAKDLSLLKYIPNLIDMGVSSFKIEGRMRSVYYLATVINIYRKVIDEYCDNPSLYEYNSSYEKELANCANRDSLPQCFMNQPGVEEQYYIGRDERSNQDFLGIVIEYDENNKEAIIEQRNFFKIGDEVEIFSPGYRFNFKIDSIKDEKGNFLEAARHPQQIIRMPLNRRVNNKDIIKVKKNIDNGNNL